MSKHGGIVCGSRRHALCDGVPNWTLQNVKLGATDGERRHHLDLMPVGGATETRCHACISFAQHVSIPRCTRSSCLWAINKPACSPSIPFCCSLKPRSHYFLRQLTMLLERLSYRRPFFCCVCSGLSGVSQCRGRKEKKHSSLRMNRSSHNG